MCPWADVLCAALPGCELVQSDAGNQDDNASEAPSHAAGRKRRRSSTSETSARAHGQIVSSASQADSNGQPSAGEAAVADSDVCPCGPGQATLTSPKQATSLLLPTADAAEAISNASSDAPDAPQSTARAQQAADLLSAQHADVVAAVLSVHPVLCSRLPLSAKIAAVPAFAHISAIRSCMQHASAAGIAHEAPNALTQGVAEDKAVEGNAGQDIKVSFGQLDVCSYVLRAIADMPDVQSVTLSHAGVSAAVETVAEGAQWSDRRGSGVSGALAGQADEAAAAAAMASFSCATHLTSVAVVGAPPVALHGALRHASTFSRLVRLSLAESDMSEALLQSPQHPTDGGVLLSWPRLRHLDLSSCALDVLAAEHLAANVLPPLTALTELRLCDNAVTAHGLAAMAAALAHAPHFAVLDATRTMALEPRQLPQRTRHQAELSFHALGRALRQLAALHTLSIARCGLGDACVGELAPWLQGNTRLRALDASGNRLGAAGAAALVSALARQAALTWLDLGTNHLADAGTRELAPHLARLSELRVLRLAVNRIGAAGAEALAPAICTLTALSVRSCMHAARRTVLHVCAFLPLAACLTCRAQSTARS